MKFFNPPDYRIQRAIDEALASDPHTACRRCGDSGRVYEQVDDDQPPRPVYCDHCHMWCRTCRVWVKRKDHQCKGEKAT